MDRILRGSIAPITVTVTVGGIPVAAGAPLQVSVTKDTGETLATGTSFPGEETGEYVFDLDALQTGAVDVLTARWTGTVGKAAVAFQTVHEVVGGFLTSVEAIEDALPKKLTVDRAKIEAARNLAEDWLEDECRVAFRPRYGRDRLDGSGTGTMLLPRPHILSVRSATVGGAAVAAPVFYPSGELRSTGLWGEGIQNVDVVYEHGFPTVPSQVSRAATLLARYFLVPDVTDYDGRASSISTETAHYTLVTPGMREAITAIPEVNVVMERFNFPSIA